MFSRVRNQIATAVKLGGGPDPTINSLLARAIEKAKEVKMPKSTIEKCLNSSSADTSERTIFEVRGSSGYLLLVETMAEHKHRHNIRAELKRILERNSRYDTSMFINKKHDTLIRSDINANHFINFVVSYITQLRL